MLQLEAQRDSSSIIGFSAVQGDFETAATGAQVLPGLRKVVARAADLILVLTATH